MAVVAAGTVCDVLVDVPNRPPVCCCGCDVLDVPNRLVPCGCDVVVGLEEPNRPPAGAGGCDVDGFLERFGRFSLSNNLLQRIMGAMIPCIEKWNRLQDTAVNVYAKSRALSQ